ncbi:MAG TPA: hypothetical protein VFH99_01430 [Candidatus Saccharimonadales bacterium]|nr:hypothetical protein [Candidatus Saccharimonadales bacterium]
MSEIATDLDTFKAVGARISFGQDEFEEFRQHIDESLAVAKKAAEFVTAATTFNGVTNELAECLPSLFPSHSTRKPLDFGRTTAESFNLTFPGMIDDAAEKVKEYREHEGIVQVATLSQHVPVEAEVLFAYKRKASSIWLEAVSTTVKKVIIAGWTDDERTNGRYDDNKPFVALIDPTKPAQKVKAYYGADPPEFNYLASGSYMEQNRAAREADVSRIETLIEAAVAALPRSAEAKSTLS